MKRKIITIALVVLLAVGAASVALSYGRGRGGGRGEFPARPAVQKTDVEKAKPALTEEQKEELRSLRADMEKETRPLRNELEIKSLELRHLWTADELDEAAIIAKSGEVSELKSQLQEKMVRHRLAAAKVLPEEQRTRFLAMSSRGRDRGLGAFGRGSRGRGRQGNVAGGRGMRNRGGRPGMQMRRW